MHPVEVKPHPSRQLPQLPRRVRGLFGRFLLARFEVIDGDSRTAGWTVSPPTAHDRSLRVDVLTCSHPAHRSPLRCGRTIQRAAAASISRTLHTECLLPSRALWKYPRCCTQLPERQHWIFPFHKQVFCLHFVFFTIVFHALPSTMMTVFNCALYTHVFKAVLPFPFLIDNNKIKIINVVDSAVFGSLSYGVCVLQLNISKSVIIKSKIRKTLFNMQLYPGVIVTTLSLCFQTSNRP